MRSPSCFQFSYNFFFVGLQFAPRASRRMLQGTHVKKLVFAQFNTRTCMCVFVYIYCCPVERMGAAPSTHWLRKKIREQLCLRRQCICGVLIFIWKIVLAASCGLNYQIFRNFFNINALIYQTYYHFSNTFLIFISLRI